jgi:glycosyltransferase involved in cell wall biosynthesis
VKEGDYQALAHALLDVVAHPDRLSAIARNGADLVRQKFEQTSQTRKLEEHYFEAMGMPAVGAVVV